MMGATLHTWDDLRRTARTIERSLEDDIAEYSSLIKSTQRPKESFDEENPLEEATGEKILAARIDTSLITLSDTIDEMSSHTATTSSKAQEALLQRYREVYFDLKSEFRRAMGSLQEKREAQKLFGNRMQPGVQEDSEVDALLNERRAVDSSRSLASSIIEQAMATKMSLENQRARFSASHNKMHTLSNSFAGINSLVEQIRRKKLRNNTILALVIAACLCFTLWWVILSNT